MKNLLDNMQRVLLGALLLTFTVLALAPRTAAGEPPAATITAIDAKTGVVTAKEKATGKLFRFKLHDPTIHSKLTVGQGVYANYRTSQVSLNGSIAHGDILQVPSFSLPILYGRVSTVTTSTFDPLAVAVYDPAISVPPSPGKQQGQLLQRHPFFTEPATPPPAPPSGPAIQFPAVPMTLPPQPQDDTCTPLGPIRPQPVNKGAVTWVDPSSGTVYFVGLPALVLREAEQNPGAQSYHATTCVKLSQNGRIDGRTHLNTGGSFGGHTAVKVYFVDIHGNTVHETPGGIGGDMWINGCPGGLSFTCSDNDHTYMWYDQFAPTEPVGDVVGVSIVQLPTGDSNFLAHLNEVLVPLKTISEIYKNVAGSSGGGGGG